MFMVLISGAWTVFYEPIQSWIYNEKMRYETQVGLEADWASSSLDFSSQDSTLKKILPLAHNKTTLRQRNL